MPQFLSKPSTFFWFVTVILAVPQGVLEIPAGNYTEQTTKIQIKQPVTAWIPAV